jgi:GST-like protein
MLDLYYWTTPNGHKVTIFLEETGLPYTIRPVNINKGEQFDPAFLAISPNNRIPAIVDHAPPDGGGPLALMESGAILLYLAGKTGRFLPAELRARCDVVQWLFWQMANLGPMAGQNHHFRHYAPMPVPYALDRYTRETGRLYRVLDNRLEGRDFIAGDYSIADMACYPWVQPARQGQDIEEFPNVGRWRAAIAQRPAVQRAYAIVDKVNPKRASAADDEASRRILFGQDQNTLPHPPHQGPATPPARPRR